MRYKLNWDKLNWFSFSLSSVVSLGNKRLFSLCHQEKQFRNDKAFEHQYMCAFLNDVFSGL